MTYRYKIWNGPMPTTAAQAPVATANGVKTMLQIAAPAGRYGTVVSWGFSIYDNGAALTTSAEVELLETDVAATVTAHVPAGVQPLDPNWPASPLTLGTAATGYNASVEGAVAATRVFDAQLLSGGTVGAEPYAYSYQFMPNSIETPVFGNGKFLRIRTTFAQTTATTLTWAVVDL